MDFEISIANLSLSHVCRDTAMTLHEMLADLISSDRKIRHFLSHEYELSFGHMISVVDELDQSRHRPINRYAIDATGPLIFFFIITG